jgi:cell division protein FtsL
MAQAARRIQADPHSARPELRLVRGGKPRVASRRRAVDEARCRRTFGVAMALLGIFCAFGAVRVTIYASAAQASVDASKLRTQIKAERIVADRLEIDRSTLMQPSRIAAIAGDTMQMAKPAHVRYIAMPFAAPAVAESAGYPEVSTDTPAARVPAPGGVSALGSAVQRALGTVIGMAGDDAHLLMAGDEGLSEPGSGQ